MIILLENSFACKSGHKCKANPVTSLCHFETAVELNLMAVETGLDSDSLSTLLGLGWVPTQTQSIGLRVPRCKGRWGMRCFYFKASRNQTRKWTQIWYTILAGLSLYAHELLLHVYKAFDMIKQAVEVHGFMGTLRDTLKPNVVLSLVCANMFNSGCFGHCFVQN